MKISTLFSILLITGMIIFVMSQMVSEADENYSVDINQSEWQGKYDFAQEVNESVNPVIVSINTITNQEAGWLEKVGAGFTGIVSAVTLLPTLVWEGGKMGGTLITGLANSFGIPSYITLVFLIMLIVWGIFELIQFFQRWSI